MHQFNPAKLVASVALTGLALSSLTSPVFAQADRQPTRNVIEEIVVTGQKREQSVQDSPLSVSAFSAQDIKDKDITNVADLQFLTPSLSIQEQGGLKFINIRGVGIATVSPQTTSGVAYHVDGFFIPNEIAFSETYFDLAGIEVYRGPQGTFLGQNSTGGAIFVNTASPGFDESGFTLAATGGSYGFKKVEGAVDVPLSNNFAMRLAGIYEEQDGYYDNIGPTGDDLDSIDRQGLRASFLYQPTDSIEIGFKYETTQNESGGAFQKDLTDGIADEFTVAYGYPTRLDLDVTRSTLEVKWDLSENLEFRSITGFQEVDQVRYEDADNTITQVHDRWIETNEETVQQEFNLVSNFGGSFEFVTGAFYFEDKSYFYSEDFIPSRLPGPAWEVTDGKPGHESWSVYAEGNFKLSDSLELIAGLRYIDDTVSDDDGGYTCRRCTSPATLTTQGRLIAESANETVSTGRVVLNWHTTDDDLWYGSISKGFKSGGFNPGRQGFDPEYVVNYEMGHKASFADGAMLWNNAVYYADYDGFQLRLYDPTTAAGSSLLNTTDKTIIYGFESEFMFISGDWTGTLGFGYGKSSLENVSEPDPRNPPPAGPVLDLDGTSLPFHPKFTLAAAIGHSLELSNGTLNTELRISHTDEQWTEIYQVTPTDFLDAYTLANLNLKYQSAGNWWLKGYVSNLTDEEYITGKRINRALRDVQFYGAPREYGIEFGWSTF
jgi:iron complex outermembrane receptor protein